MLLLIIGIFLFKGSSGGSIETYVGFNPTTIPTYLSPISIDYLRSIEFKQGEITIEETLSNGSNYKRYIVSYESDCNKIYGLLTIPNANPPEGGFQAIVFNHGYIPPKQYVTTEKYLAYVDYLARSNFVVFKIDMREHGNSEGISGGSYFSAGVIWSGAVYSYEDFAKYRLNDNSYVQRNFHFDDGKEDPNRLSPDLISKLRDSNEEINYDDPLWSSISLTKNMNSMNTPAEATTSKAPTSKLL